MNARIKQRWLKALRSGKYKQAIYDLRVGDRFCCLGVLADLYAKTHRLTWRDRGVNTGTGILSRKIVKWAGLKDGNPSVGRFCLGFHNDEGKSFKEIANLIEKHL